MATGFPSVRAQTVFPVKNASSIADGSSPAFVARHVDRVWERDFLERSA
jgi:hypothetical protein